MEKISNIPSKALPQENLHCYHCGEVCEDTSIQKEEKVFCCSGCKTVYEILAENNLCNYYSLSEKPGAKQQNRDFGDRFAFLDNPEIARTLLSFASEDLEKVTLLLPNIHCSSCIWLLENLYRVNLGITYSRVNFTKREITVSFNPQEISFRQVAELLSSLGYPPQINLQDLKSKTQKKENLHLLYKIGITGFCFGNIMLLSFPDYLAVEDWVEDGYKYFFGYLNILLALPIFFYSSYDYFKSAFKSLRAKAINLDVPITLGIFALFGRSLYEILTFTGSGYMDSLAGLLFFLLIGKWVQNRTYERLSFDRDYQSYFPLAINVRNPQNNEIEIKTVTSLKKNDIIQVRNQELIPTDGILISEKASIDYSFVSGEADPVEKTQGDYLYAGGRQVGSSIELAVQKEVSQSYLTQLWNSESFQEESQDKIHKHIAVFSKYFTLATLGISFGALLFWYFMDSSVMWNAFTAVLIIACPCALALATPYALGNAMRVLGRNHFYLRDSDVVAHLAEVNHLVFDKTGTITHNDQADIHFEGEKPLSEEHKILIKSLVRHSTHPLSRKINQYLKSTVTVEADSFKEIEGKGIYGQVQGLSLRVGSQEFTEIQRPSQDKKNDKTQLASQVFINIQGEDIGCFTIHNAYRKGLGEMLGNLQNQYQTSLVTGDNASEHERLRDLFGASSILSFQQKPKDKLAFIKNLQQNGDKTLMLGDGLNDAGALKQSEVGIALTEDTTSFSPACDAILDAKGFPLLPKFMRYSKTTMQIIRGSFALSLMYNLVGISFAVSGTLSPVLAAILMPLSSITVVGFVILATNLFARQQGLEC